MKGGVVYVFIFDKLLFWFGSLKIISEVSEVLNKLVLVINDYSDLNILVEGYMDDVLIFNFCMDDNWDFSVKWVILVVWMLVEDYYVDFIRMIVVGWFEFILKEDNGSSVGRSVNCCMEIIIILKLD